MFENASVQPILWQPNSEGLFSQFIQLKAMVYCSQEIVKRKLVVNPTRSHHFNKTLINLCNVFELEHIECVNDSTLPNRGNLGKCSNPEELSDKLSVATSREQICFIGPPFKLLSETRREGVLIAANFVNPSLRVNSAFHQSIVAFKRSLGIMGNGGKHTLNYTVVHWRRGDQLSSRCRQGKDSSVNCKSAADLVAMVRNHSHDSLVYVATNEPANSTELEVLRSASFKLYADSQLELPGYEYESLNAFVLEVALMLDASTYLGWGVSEVNDVIEHERRLLGKSHCVAKESAVTYPTWCWWLKTVLSKNMSEGVNISSVIQQTNLRKMPAFRREVHSAKRRAEKKPIDPAANADWMAILRYSRTRAQFRLDRLRRTHFFDYGSIDDLAFWGVTLCFIGIVVCLFQWRRSRTIQRLSRASKSRR